MKTTFTKDKMPHKSKYRKTYDDIESLSTGERMTVSFDENPFDKINLYNSVCAYLKRQGIRDDYLVKLIDKKINIQKVS